ncbi:MAG: YbaB/EbfC family nucleoid-associated protein [Chloroflexi bacterium]|nr:YbaB/EbfC family nucleoid-associated protein [Chloroflexota bacterium]
MPRPSRGGGRMNNPSDLMAQIQRMQEELERTQAQLAEEIVEVSVGGGAVHVRMNGQLVLEELRIDPELLDPEEIDLLQDMIVSAVNQAIAKAQALASERMSAITGGLSLPGIL